MGSNSILIQHVNKYHVGNFYNIIHDEFIVPRLYDSLEPDPGGSIMNCAYVREYISKVRRGWGKPITMNECMFVAGTFENPNRDMPEVVKLLIKSEIYYMHITAFVNCTSNGWITPLK